MVNLKSTVNNVRGWYIRCASAFQADETDAISVPRSMAAWCKRLTHRPFKAKSPGSNPGAATISSKRNVIDYYRGWENDLIKADLKLKTFPYSVLMVNLNYDFNFATFLRNANALGAKNIYYYSAKKRYDKRGTIGTDHYTVPIHIRTGKDVLKLKKEYTFVAIETGNDGKSLDSFVWPDNPLLIFGSENMGLSQSILDMCDYRVYIPMYGSVRSFNTGCASAIVMHDFVRKYKEGNNANS